MGSQGTTPNKKKRGRETDRSLHTPGAVAESHHDSGQIIMEHTTDKKPSVFH
jgi:hypothetical protein